MGWIEVRTKLLLNRDDKKINCSDSREAAYAGKILREEFPQLSDSEINKAMADCCSEGGSPAGVEDFIECLKKRLDVYGLQSEKEKED